MGANIGAVPRPNDDILDTTLKQCCGRQWAYRRLTVGARRQRKRTRTSDRWTNRSGDDGACRRADLVAWESSLAGSDRGRAGAGRAVCAAGVVEDLFGAC